MKSGGIKVIVITMIIIIIILENKENREWDLDYSKHLSLTLCFKGALTTSPQRKNNNEP